MKVPLVIVTFDLPRMYFFFGQQFHSHLWGEMALQLCILRLGLVQNLILANKSKKGADILSIVMSRSFSEVMPRHIASYFSRYGTFFPFIVVVPSSYPNEETFRMCRSVWNFLKMLE